MPFAPASNGAYTLSVPLQTAGDFTLQVDANVVRADGSTLALGQPTIGHFSVLPSRPIRLVLLSPQTVDQYTSNGFPPTYPTNFVIQFEAQRTEDNSLIALESVAGNPASVWAVSVT